MYVHTLREFRLSTLALLPSNCLQTFRENDYIFEIILKNKIHIFPYCVSVIKNAFVITKVATEMCHSLQWPPGKNIKL